MSKLKDFGNSANFRSLREDGISTEVAQQAENLVLRNIRTQVVEKIIFPSEVQVGSKENPNLKSDLSIAGNLSLDEASYINFGSLTGEESFGLRSSSGDIQFKNSGGTWSSLSSITVAGSDRQIQFNDGGDFGGDNGLLYNKTSNNLFVAGVVTGSLGLSGSLTRLADGTSFLAGGSNITITSSSNGQISIAGAAATLGMAAYIISTEKVLINGTTGTGTIINDSQAVVNTDVVSGATNGVFTIASTGYYKVNAFVVVKGLNNGRSDVKIRASFTNGGNTNTTYTSAIIGTLGATSVKISLNNAYFNFTDASTRQVKIEILATTTGNSADSIQSDDGLGYPFGLIEITKLT